MGLISGNTLASWVAENVLDRLTDGRHAILRRAAECLVLPDSSSSSAMLSTKLQPVAELVRAHVARDQLLDLGKGQIDMAALVKYSEELYLSEKEWEGRKYIVTAQVPVQTKPTAVDEDAMDVDADGAGAGGTTAPSTRMTTNRTSEAPEILANVLKYNAEVITFLHSLASSERTTTSLAHPDVKQEQGDTVKLETDHFAPARLETDSSATFKGTSPSTDHESTSTGRDAVLRNLRLNLLALAKRAPLDQISKLPKDLVPESIRSFVPVLDI